MDCCLLKCWTTQRNETYICINTWHDTMVWLLKSAQTLPVQPRLNRASVQSLPTISDPQMLPSITIKDSRIWQRNMILWAVWVDQTGFHLPLRTVSFQDLPCWRFILYSKSDFSLVRMLLLNKVRKRVYKSQPTTSSSTLIHENTTKHNVCSVVLFTAHQRHCLTVSQWSRLSIWRTNCLHSNCCG